MLLILMSIVDGGGIVDRKDFAKRLYNWMQNGFRELGDHCMCAFDRFISWGWVEEVNDYRMG